MACKRNCNDCCECLSSIPDGGTCQESCRHFAHPCSTIFGQKGHETFCQWVPSRFLAKATYKGSLGFKTDYIGTFEPHEGGARDGE